MPERHNCGRFAQFNLELAEEKTRLLLFGRFAAIPCSCSVSMGTARNRGVSAAANSDARLPSQRS
jgi:hypothetical protein